MLRNKVHGFAITAIRALQARLASIEQKHTPDEFVFDEFKSRLIHLDEKLPELNNREIHRALDLIPLQVFGEIQIDRPSYLSNLLTWLPRMPTQDVQISWTGSSDRVLLNQSVAFMQVIVAKYHELTDTPLVDANVLDFGCGWGRLLRLLYKYSPIGNIYGVDPWDESIRLCHECGIKSKLYVSDYLPRSLPTPKGLKFDLIIAFSVFTHLSPKAALISINTLKNHLTDDGMLAITVMPKEYWAYRQTLTPDEDLSRYINDHLEKGIAFRPHGREKIEGEVTYGDTTTSIDFIKEHFTGLEVDAIEWSKIDPYQIVVFLRKRSAG